ncbi:MAG TPA: M50 family metallopeptidase [Acidimicrobiales bacterium]|nr:M50 family metallopeptidase [Acidimicrobiales bacterium]
MTELETGPRRPPPGFGTPAPRPARPGGSSGRELVQLAIVVAAVVLAAVVTGTADILVVIVALIVMVMLHELGHFATAKWSHMKVTEYFLGFGPRLWSVRRGETEYGIKAIPAGGYVRIVGMSNLEEVDPADEPRSYRQQPFRNRLVVALAGSFMHGVMAFVLVWAYFTFSGVPSADVVRIQALAPLSHNLDPARTAGLRAGDIVKSIDGKAVTGPDMVIHLVGSHAGTPVTIVVERAGAERTVVVTPVADNPAGASATAAPTGHIGVVLGEGSRSVGPIGAVAKSGVAIGSTVTASFSALGQIFSAHGLSQYWHDLTNSKAAAASEHSAVRIQSIYGAVRTAAQGVQAGWGAFVAVFVSINVFVGILNLLPMLPLDGGHVAIAVYERIRSRKGRRYHADVAKLAPVAYAFVVFLGFIVVSSLYLDITHPVANPFH